MGREDIRISLSFKNNIQEKELYDYVIKKGEIVGISSYLKMLIQKAMLEEKLNGNK